MAKTEVKETQKGIRVTCHGMYYYKTDALKGVKHYDISLRAPSLEFFRETTSKYLGTDDSGKQRYAERSFINIRGILKKRLLPMLLARKYNDFSRVKYVIIDEVVSETGQELDLPIMLMSKAQLARMVKSQDIPVDPQEYIDIDNLRTDVREYLDDPKAFLASKSRRDKRRAEERAFIEMNELDETLPPKRGRQDEDRSGTEKPQRGSGSGGSVIDPAL